MTKWQPVWLKLTQECYLQHLLRQKTTARVFLQISQWKDPNCDMPAEEWGWTLTESGLGPTMTEMTPAPPELLKMIRCSCATDCGSARCTCRKHGMKCSTACGHCQGSSCSNANTVVEDEEDSDSDEE